MFPRFIEAHPLDLFRDIEKIRFKEKFLPLVLDLTTKRESKIFSSLSLVVTLSLDSVIGFHEFGNILIPDFLIFFDCKFGFFSRKVTRFAVYLNIPLFLQ